MKMDKSYRKNRGNLKIALLLGMVFLAIVLYMTVGVRFDHPRLLAYALNLRSKKVMVMILTAISIGVASMVFQSVINNTIVTPCLLGMNALYMMIHTAVVFLELSRKV